MASKAPDSVVAEYYLIRLMQWRESTERLDAALAREIKAELEKLRKGMSRELVGAAGMIAESKGITRAQLEGMDRWIDDSIAGASAAVVKSISVPTLAVASASLALGNDMLSMGGMVKEFRSAELTDEMMLAWFDQSPVLRGGTLQAWVDKVFSDGVKAEIFNTLRISNMQGEGYAKMVKGLLQKGLSLGIAVTEREAVTLARTYTQTANVGAMEAVYEANRKIIPEIMWVTALDNRVCPLCATLDGHKWKTDDMRRPPMPRHPRCRCMWQPVPVSFRSLGLDMDDIEVTRRWVVRERGNVGVGGRKVLATGTTKENFSGWWQTLPVGMQNQSIGAVRAGLVRDGNLSWKDLVDFKTGRYYTLDELGFGRDGKRV